MKSIIFNQHQVNHALKNKEGMFRVVVKPQPRKEVEWSDCGILQDKVARIDLDKSPYQVGQEIFCKETFCEVNDEQFGEKNWIDYRATPKFAAIL